jgi:hypothetical protein
MYCTVHKVSIESLTTVSCYSITPFLFLRSISSYMPRSTPCFAFFSIEVLGKARPAEWSPAFGTAGALA